MRGGRGTGPRNSGPFAGRAHGGDPDAAIARRVGWRLAALTVGLLCALLLVLGLTIYFSTRNVLLDSLRRTVQGHAQGFIVAATAPGPSPGRDGGSNSFQRSRPPGPPDGAHRGDFGDGVFTTVADGALHVLYSEPPISGTLVDPAAARAVLVGRLSSAYSTQQVNAQGPYLIYTARGPGRRRHRDGGRAVSHLRAAVPGKFA